MLNSGWESSPGGLAMTHPHQPQECLYVPIMLCCLYTVSSVHVLSARRGFLVLRSHQFDLIGGDSMDGWGRA